MRSRADTGLLTAGLVVTAAALGLAVIFRPGIAIPFTIELIVLFGITVWLVSREADPALVVWLRRLILGALAIRVALAVAIHFGPQLTPYFFAPDAIGYEQAGRELATYWQGRGPAPPSVSEGWRQGYHYLNGYFFVIFGESSIALVVLNMFASIWTVLLTFSLTRELLNVQAAKVTALLTAFFPSLVLWSVLNIRDAMATLLVVLMVWASIRLNLRPRPRDLLLLFLGLAGLAAIRDYMGFLVLSGLILGAFAAVRPGRMWASLTLGTVLVLFLTYSAERLTLFSSFSPDEMLGTAQLLRAGLQANATSAFGIGASTETLGGALGYLPLGVSYLLFAPFPWAIESLLQTIAMPETVLWYPLFLLALQGMWSFRKSRQLASVMIPLSVLLVVTTSYALVEGNFGTAYRHRAQIMPLFFIFSGVGISWFNRRVLRFAPWSRRVRAEVARHRRRRFAQPLRRL